MSKKTKEKEIIEKLKTKLTPRRYQHSLGVRDTAVLLARQHGLNEEKAALAGLIHDWARELSGSAMLNKAQQFGIPLDKICLARPDLLHGFVGAELIKQEFGIGDQEIKQAIAQHTMGSENMGNLAKVIFLADYIEPNRDYPGVEAIREAAFDNLNLAVVLAADQTVRHLLEKKELIHPQTIATRNAFLLLVNKNM